MTGTERKDRLEFLADVAAEKLDQLPPMERARLFEGIALVSSGKRKERADIAAYTIRKAENAQLKFKELLKS